LVKDTGLRIRVKHEPVVKFDGVVAGNSRNDTFPPAGIPGAIVIVDGTYQYHPVRIYRNLI
jgi:hypothetical protein